MGWIEQAHERANVQQVVQALGLRVGRHHSVGPCPACNAEHRGSEDRRGPVGLRGDGKGWHCFKCEASGDGLELVALVRMGARMRELTREQRLDVREWVAAQGWCDPPEPGGMIVTPRGDRPAPGRRGRATPRPSTPATQVVQASAVGRRKAPEPEPPAPSAGIFGWQPDLPDRCEADLWSEDGRHVLAYLQGRGFNEDTLRHWKIGALLVREQGRVVEQYVAIPVPRRDGVIVNMRYRSVPGTCLRCGGKGCERRRGLSTCKGGQVRKVYARVTGAPTTLFGVHQLDGDADSEVVICEGELDVIALWQYGLRANVVTGTAGAKTWADDWLDELEPYRTFVLAYDDDDDGDKGAAKVAEALGLARCSRAKLPEGDAAACLEACTSQRAVHAALDAAEPMLRGVRLVTVDSYADELESLISNPDKLRGLPTGSAKLDEGIGGWSPGLVIVTGDTAAGKTTFTTWASLEQALRYVPCMLTSFEQKPIGTVQKLLRAQLGGDFTEYSERERRQGMAALGKLPLYVLDHYGELDTEAALLVLDYAVRRRGVRFAVLDHLGFLVRNAEDERRAIEHAVRSLALFAVQREITVVLICHPNNLSVVQQRRVQLGDLKGASAIRQDAHTGLVVERLVPGRGVKNPAAAVHCDKVRSEFGQQGARLTLHFDPLACVYADSWDATPMGRAGRTGGTMVQPDEQAGPGRLGH